MVKIVAQGTPFEIDPRVEKLTTYFKDIQDFNGPTEEIELKTYAPADIGRVLKACEVADFHFKEVTRVNGNDPIVYIGENLTKYFDSLKNEQLNTTFKAAKQLRIKGLENHIAAYLASKVFIKLNLQEYNKKKQELGITKELTPERSKELKERYAFLN